MAFSTYNNATTALFTCFCWLYLTSFVFFVNILYNELPKLRSTIKLDDARLNDLLIISEMFNYVVLFIILVTIFFGFYAFYKNRPKLIQMVRFVFFFLVFAFCFGFHWNHSNDWICLSLPLRKQYGILTVVCFSLQIPFYIVVNETLNLWPRNQEIRKEFGVPHLPFDQDHNTPTVIAILIGFFQIVTVGLSFYITRDKKIVYNPPNLLL